MKSLDKTLYILEKLEDIGFESGKLCSSASVHPDCCTDTGTCTIWSVSIMADYDNGRREFGVDIVIDYTIMADGTLVLHDGNEDMCVTGGLLCSDDVIAIKEMLIVKHSVIEVESLEQMEMMRGNWLEFIGREL